MILSFFYLQLVYDFSNESCAMEMAVSRQKEVEKEKEKLLTMSSINDTNNIQSEVRFYDDMLTPKEVTNSSSNIENDPSQFITVTKSNEINHMLRRNSVPNTIKIFQNNFDILRPQPSHYNCDLKKPNREEIIPINRIDPRDFESSSSSPFDDALLKAIDEKQELNRVFQHL